jgi:hypothetical protein
MTRNTFTINFNFQFDPTRKYTKYSVDGEHWLNNGEFAEIADKAVKGYGLNKDPNTAYDMGSDIEQTKTSVKSGKATLTNKVLGENKEEVIKTYFSNVHSTNWDWVVVVDDKVIIYNMNAKEFEEFTTEWAGYDTTRKVIRYKSTSGIMLKWLEDRI